MITITLLSFIFSIVISIITIRSIINPIRVATNVAIEISKGNFETINKYYAN